MWRWFGELAGARGSNGWGPNPLTWADLGAWQRLTGARPSPWELQCLLELDRLYLREVGKAASERKGA